MGYSLQEFTTETGQQSIVEVSPEHDVTIVLQGTGGSDDIDIEVILDNPKKTGAIRSKLEENVLPAAGTNTYTKTLEGPVRGIGIDIDANVSNSIKFQVLSARRGG
jgi:hypothetical protein